MQQIIENYYLIAFLISAALTCVYAFMWHKHFHVIFSLIFAFIPAVNLGYYMSVSSENVDGVIAGIKISYLGGCFLLLFVTLHIFNLCHINISKTFERLLIVFAMITYMGALTIGHSHLFYNDITVTFENGVMHQYRDYGPLHTVMYLIVALYFLMAFFAMIYAFIAKKEVPKRIIWLLFIPEMVAFLTFFGSKLAFEMVELTPVAYIFAQIMYLFIAHYLCLYDVTDVAVDSLTEAGLMGFISLDKKMDYLGSTPTAHKVFENLSNLAIDKPLSQDKEIYDTFSPWLKKFMEDENQNKFYYTKGDNIYLVEIHYLLHDGRKRGYQITISDDTQNQKYIKLIASYNSDLEKEVKIKTDNIVRMHNDFIRSMATLVESRDNSTGGHIVRTSDMVELLMSEIMKDGEFVTANNITESFVADIIKAASLHDIGKIAVSDLILQKKGKFTKEEYEKMKKHSAEGARVLERILDEKDDPQFKKIAINVAHYHHEKMDGSGYPEHLKGDEIPLEARIMAIADVYDALVSKRWYKEKMEFDEADRIMMESMGSHFDKRLEKFYVAARPKMEEYYKTKEDTDVFPGME